MLKTLEKHNCTRTAPDNQQSMPSKYDDQEDLPTTSISNKQPKISTNKKQHHTQKSHKTFMTKKLTTNYFFKRF